MDIVISKLLIFRSEMRNWEKLFRLLVVVTLSKFALLAQKFDLCLLFVLCGCSLHFPSFSILSLYTSTFPLFYSFLFPPFPLFSFSPPPCFPIPALFSSPLCISFLPSHSSSSLLSLHWRLFPVCYAVWLIDQL